MSNNTLTLTIVIPAYNEQDYLAACLDTIASQTIMPDEVIVVDNNSADNTVKIAQKYSFVKVIKEKNQGIVFARNRGFEASAANLIGRIDADTLLSNDWAAQVKKIFASHPEIAAVTGTNYFYDFPFRNFVHALHTFTYYVLQKWIAGTNILWASNMVITRTAWDAVKSQCDSTSRGHEDIDLSLRLKKKGLSIERSGLLRAEVSMRRGDLSVASLSKYLKAWHRTYLINHYYLRAIIIMILEVLTLFTAIISKPIVAIANLMPANKA